MAWWKQAIALAVLIAAAATAWARFDEGAVSRLENLGVPPSLLRIVAGGSASGEKPAREQSSAQQGGNRQREALVIVAPVGEGRINDRLTAIGDGAAIHSVSVTPLAAGVLAEVAVRSGDRVRAGDSLARLDQRAEEIARDRAALALKTAEDKLARVEALVKSRTATAVQFAEARDERDAALFALRDAELELDRRTVRAPIDGIVGIVTASAGNAVTTQSEIAAIDDRSAILVEFWAPERFAGQIAPGQPVAAYALASPGDEFTGRIDAVASRIERDSRTLRVRAIVDNAADRLRPGMSFEVTMRFPGAAFPAVDPLAVQWSSDGAFVWRIVDDKAERIAVRVIQRNSDDLLVDGPLKPGDAIVTEGVQSLRPGMPVRIDSQPIPAGS